MRYSTPNPERRARSGAKRCTDFSPAAAGLSLRGLGIPCPHGGSAESEEERGSSPRRTARRTRPRTFSEIPVLPLDSSRVDDAPLDCEYRLRPPPLVICPPKNKHNRAAKRNC